MMSDAELYRLASWSTWVSIVTLVIAGITLAIFFAGPGEPFGSINDAAFALTLILLIPAVLAVDRLAGERFAPMVRIVTIAAIGGIMLAAIGQLLLIVRVITLEDSYITGGLGILPVLAWLIIVAAVSLVAGLLPSTVGWLAVASLLLVVVTGVVSAMTTGPLLWVACIALLAVLCAWLAALAVAFAALSPTPVAVVA